MPGLSTAARERSNVEGKTEKVKVSHERNQVNHALTEGRAISYPLICSAFGWLHRRNIFLLFRMYFNLLSEVALRGAAVSLEYTL